MKKEQKGKLDTVRQQPVGNSALRAPGAIGEERSDSHHRQSSDGSLSAPGDQTVTGVTLRPSEQSVLNTESMQLPCRSVRTQLC